MFHVRYEDDGDEEDMEHWELKKYVQEDGDTGNYVYHVQGQGICILLCFGTCLCDMHDCCVFCICYYISLYVQCELNI